MTKRRLTFISYFCGVLDVRVLGYGLQVRPRPWAWMVVTPRTITHYDIPEMNDNFWAELARASVAAGVEKRPWL